MLISGEAGIGKSRIALSDASNTTVALSDVFSNFFTTLIQLSNA
jgi:hypothetical protein